MTRSLMLMIVSSLITAGSCRCSETTPQPTEKVLEVFAPIEFMGTDTYSHPHIIATVQSTVLMQFRPDLPRNTLWSGFVIEEHEDAVVTALHPYLSDPIMTNQHGQQLFPLLDPVDQTTFRPGQLLDQHGVRGDGSSPCLVVGVDAIGGSQSEDWIVLRSYCHGRAAVTKPLRIGARPNIDQRLYFMAPYPDVESRTFRWGYTHGRVTKVLDDEIVADFQAWGGSSGAPVLNDRTEVVGMLVRNDPATGARIFPIDRVRFTGP